MTQTTIIGNGTIHSMDPDQPNPDWVEIRDGKILGTGVGLAPAGRRLDLAGRTLLPGFHDAHVHPSLGGLSLVRCDLHDLATVEDFVAEVAHYGTKNPHAPWILGGGWSMEDVPNGIARAEWLDAVVPNRPVYLGSSEGHAAWVNSKALELAGIDADTPDPVDGRIERDPDGTPTGTLQEGAAYLVAKVLPPTSLAEAAEGILAAQSLLLSLGITTFQDAWVERATHEAYRSLDSAGQLIAKATASLWWERDRGLEQLPELIERFSETGRRYRPGSIKFMVDGVCENGTASMVHPYVGTHDDCGLVFISRDMLLEAVPQTMAAGIQPHFHAIGDRAIRDSLDAVAAGDPADAKRVRPQIAHVQVVDPDDIHRFAQLHVGANAQMLWACNDDTMLDLTTPRLGEARNRWQFPFRRLIDAGAHFACGSDWSVSTANPFPQIQVAVTRLMPGMDAPFQLEQAITVEEALRGFTTGSAWINHEEKNSGSITPGKAADLVIVNQDPLSAPDLASTTVELTLVGGQVVYEA